MEEGDEKLREFTEEFFKSLGCKISIVGEGILIENVPESFEKYYGKNSPYKVVFYREEKEGFEIVTKGSYLLKAMTSYLEKSGETTLLKIDFKIDGEEEIKKRIKLDNCEIARLSKNKKYDYFTRFTFLTTFQYLNGKEQVTNDIYVYKGKVTKGDLESYDVSEGDKREINIENIEESYNTAREELRSLLTGKTELLKKELEEKLEKEVLRIEEHFKQRIKEMEESLEKSLDKRKTFEIQLGQGNDEEITSKIKKIDSDIELVQKDNLIDNFEKEKENELKAELYKHGLNISNKLMNTTIIYYPLLSFNILLKNSTSNRLIEINYNPLTGEMNDIFCDSCSTKLNELLLDGAGHLICKKCAIRCGDCGEIHCKKCLIKECSLCGKKICMNCATKCNSCGKDFCKSHTRKDAFDGKDYCLNCVSRCEVCGEYFKKKKSSERQICEKCRIKEIEKNTIKDIFD